nr:reverse transcriptase domain-containing protein [Tanacetum cinerariifolium]
MSSFYESSQYHIYLYQVCESNSHYGYECSQRVPLVYEPEPCYIQNFSDNNYSHNLPSVDPLIDHNCCYKCGNSLNDFFCHHCTCEFCGNDVHVVYNCPTQVSSFQTLPSFPQQYPCCEDCGDLSEAYQIQTPQYTVNHSIFNAHNNLLDSQNKLMEQMTYMCEMVDQLIQKKQEEKQIQEDQAANARYWKIPAYYDDDDDYNFAITPNETVDSLIMGDEHLDTISATKSDEFIKSSVENLIDSLLDEFVDELTLLKSISPGIDETNYHPKNEIRLSHRLLYENSSPRPPEEFVSENSNADVESFSPFSIRIEDSNSFMEEIDLTFTPDDPMPPSIEEDDDDSRDILIREELLDNYSLPLPENESFHFDITLSYRPPAKPPNGNAGILNIKMMGDVSFQKVPIPGLTITLVSNQEKSPDLLSHRGFEIFQPSAECPMKIHGKNIPTLDTHTEGFYPPSLHFLSFNWESFDSLLDEFAGELIFLKSIPPGIDEADCDSEEEICLIEKLLYDNSSPRPPEEFNSENSDALIESFSPSPIPVEDSIDSDYSDSERDNLFPERLMHDDPIPLPDILDSSNVVQIFPPFFTYPVSKKGRIIPLHPIFPDQEVVVGGSLSDKERTELCALLKQNLDIFTWQPSDMTGVPRSIAKHRLNIREGCPPVRQKKRGQAPERTKAIQAEVQKLVEARIMREVYYHDWLSNPVMVKKHDGSWRMCVDFTDLNKAYAYKGYHQIQLAAADEEKIAFHTGEGVYCYTKMPFGLKNAGATYQRLMDKAFESKMGQNIEVYVDDLVVKSHTEAEMTLKKCIKKSDFRWTTKAEQAFQQLKQHLSNLLLLAAPKPQEELIMYLSATHGAISTVLLTERGMAQTPVYFIGRALQGPKLNYSPMEKLVLSLVFAGLRRYFQAHPITVITDQPIKQVMSCPDVVGRLQKWSIMLGEHNITYRPRTSIKGQILADFLNEMPSNASQDRSGAGLILTNPDGVEFTYALRFQFAASNNEVEYEALIAGLQIATQIGVKNIQANVDSKLVANQMLGMYVAKEDNMIKYLDITKGLVSGFKTFSISQVPRSRNKKADALSKIASTSFAHLSKQVLVELLETKSITGKEVTTVIEEEGPTWMTELVNYLKEGILPEDEKEARKIRLKARQYELMEGILYKRSFLTPWLRCVGPLQAEYVMKEIHEGSCSMHVGPQPVVAKAIRLGYFWPTMHKDAQDMIRKCSDCQIHRPFPKGPGKVKFLIVAMDYFTKWIEAKAVATITGGQVKKFVWDNIVCRFGIPGEIISENGKQFTDNPFKDWCDKLNITQRFASVKHPQSNGLVERANRSLGEVIPAKIGMPTYRTTVVDVVNNDKELRLNLDLLEERWELTTMSEAKSKSKMMKYYNSRVRGVAFKPGDFVYRSNDASHAIAGGKLGPK